MKASVHIHTLPSCKYDWLLARCSTLDDAPFISRVSQHVCAHRPSTTNDLVGRVTGRDDWPPVGEARGISQTGLFPRRLCVAGQVHNVENGGRLGQQKTGEHLGEEQGGRLERKGSDGLAGISGNGGGASTASREGKPSEAGEQEGRTDAHMHTHMHAHTRRDEAHAGRTPVTGLCVRYGGFLPLLSPAPRRICWCWLLAVGHAGSLRRVAGSGLTRPRERVVEAAM